MAYWLTILFSTLALASGPDLGQMREFIRMACRELGFPANAIPADLARQIHDSLRASKPHGGVVTYADVLSEVHSRETSFRQSRFSGRRGNVGRNAGRIAGLAGVAVVVIDSVAHGRAPGMHDLAEGALTAVPVVGPVVATYLIAQPIVEARTQAALDAHSQLEAANQETDRLRWNEAHLLAQRIANAYNREDRFPWQGSSGGERWRTVATINYERLAYCMNQLTAALHARRLVHEARESSDQSAQYVLRRTFEPCIWNTGEYASDDPARRTFQPRAPEAELRPHAGGGTSVTH